MPPKTNEHIGLREFLESRLDQIDERIDHITEHVENLVKWQTTQEAMTTQNAKIRNWLFGGVTIGLVIIGLLMRYFKL